MIIVSAIAFFNGCTYMSLLCPQESKKIESRFVFSHGLSYLCSLYQTIRSAN